MIVFWGTELLSESVRHYAATRPCRRLPQPPSAFRTAASRSGSTRHHIQRPRFSPTSSPASARTLV